MPTEKISLKEQVALLPYSPGVYQFVDRTGRIIYVGKAKSLRKRVSSYFVESREHSAKVRVLVRQIVEIRHIVVGSETDALLLENSLIKSLQPRYNILLKDDKTYPGSSCGASASRACNRPGGSSATARSTTAPTARS